MSKRTETDVLADFESRTRALLGMPEATSTDGRVAIRLRNREKIIDAFVGLVVEGKAGSIEEIVERSGVGRRSIFRHFADLSDLALAAMRSVIAVSAPIAILDNPGVGPLDQRIESFVRARLGVVAVMYPFRSGVTARIAVLDTYKAGLAATVDMVRVQIETHFARELDPLSAVDRAQVVDAVYTASSYESYTIAHAQLGRSMDTIRATWLWALKCLLPPQPN